MNNRNIWIINCYDQPDGQSRRVFDFAKYFVINNCNVTAFTNNYCHFQHKNKKNILWYKLWYIEDWEGVKVVWLKSIPYKTNGIFRFINAIFNTFLTFIYAIVNFKSACDFLITPSVPIQSAYIGLFISSFKKAKHIYEIRDLWPIVLVEMGAIQKKSFVYFLFRFMEKKIYKKTHYIISTIDNVNDHIKKSGGNINNISIIPNGIDFKLFENFEYTTPSNTKFICKYFGGFSNDHDVELIIKAADIILKNGHNDIVFEVFGEGQNWNFCETLAIKLGVLNKNFYLNKPIPKKELLKYQSNADILIVAIKDLKSYKYGINLNKLLYYYLSSKPILISSGLDFNPVTLADCGLSVKPDPHQFANAVVEMKNWNNEERANKGKNGFNYGQKYLDINHLVSDYLNIFDTLKK
jgi:hypothetical protein